LIFVSSDPSGVKFEVQGDFRPAGPTTIPGYKA
jgi:hypothetical protein